MSTLLQTFLKIFGPIERLGFQSCLSFLKVVDLFSSHAALASCFLRIENEGITRLTLLLLGEEKWRSKAGLYL